MALACFSFGLGRSSFLTGSPSATLSGSPPSVGGASSPLAAPAAARSPPFAHPALACRLSGLRSTAEADTTEKMPCRLRRTFTLILDASPSAAGTTLSTVKLPSCRSGWGTAASFGYLASRLKGLLR
uniref:Putative secreted protein n=1 Tax=Ixodes ricinus TaxID=34613 RepID=A0A6B0UPR1_IXORI